MLAALAALILLGLSGTIGAPGASSNAAAGQDLILYHHIIDDVRAGESYYPAATREQRKQGYPLRPFVTVRFPTLAVAMAALPAESARRLSLSALALTVLAAWAWRLRSFTAGPLHLGAMIALMSTGVMFAIIESAYLMHECWAGLLIALSLAIWRPGRWTASLVVGLGAVCIRELAAPYLLAMAVMAWRDRAWTEAAAWAGGLASFAILMILHATAAQPWVRPSDPISASWLAFGGWPQLLAVLRLNAVLANAPAWAAALFAPFVMLGLIARGGRLGDRLALVVIGYLAAFTMVGRSNNLYWGLMITPLCPIALGFAWPAFVSLMQRAFGAVRPILKFRQV
ncbi:MAG TPA: hypothetical protein VJP88_11035 [Caulobacteraceae bacterium]|nr:hypothetical protein [Caulobacteraceae bacterium]